MAAVLDGPNALWAELSGPAQQGEMILAGCAGGPLTELAAGRIDSDGGVAAFVRVDSDDHHGRVSLHQTGDCDRSGGHLSVGAMPRSYQATPGRSATSPAAQLDEATTGRMWWSEPMTPRS